MSNFMARTAKKLVREKGILSTPNPKPSHSITQTKHRRRKISKVGGGAQYVIAKKIHKTCLQIVNSRAKKARTGGTVKRLAAQASLQRPYEHQILTLSVGRG